MSYRAFKKLLGESSLERKCRFLLGSAIILLMTLSFYVFARQTEHIAYEQTETTGRLLVNPIVARLHVSKDSREAMDNFQAKNELSWPELLREYKYKIIKPKSSKPEYKPEGEELAILNKFLADSEKNEESRFITSRGTFSYYGALRVAPSCIDCHNRLENRSLENSYKEGDLMAVVSIRLSTKDIENAIHFNRALLISAALFTSLMIMAGTYLIIRYVIVKPVKHLKEVSVAIANGHLDVRSDIQTGDEFEDLSDAFNSMLRELVNMQNRDKKLNLDLDRKVEELARANMALYQSNQMKNDFLATMSHELRTPLNSILGFSDVLLSNSGQLSEKQARWAVNIKNSGQQLLNLINDILDLAKIEAGKIEVNVSEISLPELYDSVTNLFKQSAEKKNIELRLPQDPKPILVYQDGVKLRQILSNLISNAIKFTPEGGSISVQLEQEDNNFILTISDTGVGIAIEDQAVIFEKFRQGGNPLTREHEGTGLGLSIVRELSRLLGGDVTVESELGRGSTFRVKLPMKLRPEPQHDLLLPISKEINNPNRHTDLLLKENDKPNI